MTAIRLGLTVPAALKLWPMTDLLIGIGTRLDVPIGRWGGMPPGAKLARIDIDPAEMHRVRADVPIVADAADGARALTEAVQPRADADARRRRSRRRRPTHGRR